MPKQTRGFFSCDYCGVVCDTLEEAKEHEISQCPRRPQHPQPAQGTPYFRQQTAYGMGPLSNDTEQYSTIPARAPPPHEAHKSRSVPLMGPYDRGHISPEDSLACQNIELFEATSEHVTAHNSTQTGNTPVTVKQVGIRCLHCSRNPQSSTAYSVIFPGSLGSIASSVRMVADQHLNTCQVAPPEIREAFENALNKRQRDTANEQGRNEDDRNRMALLDYCIGFCQQLGIVNKQPHKSGLEFGDLGESNHPYPSPNGVVETPGARLGERMGPPLSIDRMGFPTPGPHGIMSRNGPHMLGNAPFQGDIAPTPLQRRRDRPEAADRLPVYSAEREGGPPSTGYPTPYSQGPPEGYSGPEGPGVQTPAQPNFEGPEGGAYPTPHSEASPGYQQYDLPSNFPFYQEANRTWHCKFCSHVHPQYRDPYAVWSSPTPPPGNFIDQHLSMCRMYHQSMSSPPMYTGPAYAPPFMAPQHMPPYGPNQGLDPHSPQGVPPQHLQYPPHGEPPYPYPPPHPDNRYGFPDDLNYPRPMPPPGPHNSSVPRSNTQPGSQRRENIADSVRLAISHLTALENERFARDPAGTKLTRLVLEEDKLLLTDYFFYLMKQLKLCRFGESDRKTRGGKREKIKIGYGGLQCVHCADVPNSRKFFWSNVDRLANSFAEIPGHILKCRRCTQQTKDALLQLKQLHSEQMSKLPRGSQKVFFRRMWRRLHDEDPNTSTTVDPSNAENVAPEKTDASNSDKPSEGELKKAPETPPEAGTDTSEETLLVMQRTAKEAAKALAETPSGPSSPSTRVLLSIPEDKEWLSDMDCFIRKQLEVFCATEDDVATAASDRKYPVHPGQVGIRCIHCSTVKGGPGAAGTAVAFPFAISGIYESVREFQRLHLDSCENLPASTKAKLDSFKGSSSLSSVLRKYYVLAAKALGLQDTREGIRSSGESVPLKSQAASSFAEASGTPVSQEMRRNLAFAAEGGSQANALVPSPVPPAASTVPPATSTEPPATSTEPPAASTEPPATSTELPATSTEPPATSAEPPATSAEPPATSAEPPATSESPKEEEGKKRSAPSVEPEDSPLPKAAKGLVADVEGETAQV